MTDRVQLLAPEAPVVFGGDRELIGVLTRAARRPPGGSPATAIFLNSGLIHRVGPNRLHVRMARRLARHGFTSLRFDFSGVGDSRPARDARPITERWLAEIGSAMEFLRAETGADRFLVAGNCSGAIGAYLAAHADPRVTAVALINPPPPRVPGRYWLRLATAQSNAWRRLLRGGRRRVGGPGAALASNGAAAPSRATEGEVIQGVLELARQEKRILVVHSEWDPGYDYFHRVVAPRIPADEVGGRVRFEVIRGANHDFSLLSVQEALLDLVEGWATSRVTA